MVATAADRAAVTSLRKRRGSSSGLRAALPSARTRGATYLAKNTELKGKLRERVTV